MDVDDAIRRWAARKLHVADDQVKDVDFGIIYGGYCETCQYETFGATVTLANGKRREIEEYDATDVIREISEMYAAGSS